MERVLVYGVKDPPGGVEKIAMEYIRRIVQCHDLRFDLLVFDEQFSQKEIYEQMGCGVYCVPTRRKDPVGYKREVGRIFAENQYRAVWCNFAGLTNIDLLIMGKKHSVPVRIAHSHGSRFYWGNPVMKYVVPVLHHMNRLRVDKYATDFWTCSDVAGEFMFPKRLQNQVELIPNAVDTDIFYLDPVQRRAKRAELGLPEETPVVGHVARICEVKNQAFLLEVMSELVKKVPEAKLLFVGDGELYPQIRSKIQELGLDDCVIMTGERSDVPELLRAMDVFVLTSFSEGLSVSAVEAQASGLPCVLPDTVSKLTDVTGNVRFLNLDMPAAEWAEQILEKSAIGAACVKEKLVAAGYDLSHAAEMLYQRFMGIAE